MRDLRAEPTVALGIPQEVDDLPDFVLDVLDARDVGDVVRFADPGSYRRARDLPMPPKPAMPPRPAAPLRYHPASRPPSSSAGPNHSRSCSHSGGPWLGGLALTITPVACSRWKSWSLAKVGRSVVNCCTFTACVINSVANHQS